MLRHPSATNKQQYCHGSVTMPGERNENNYIKKSCEKEKKGEEERKLLTYFVTFVSWNRAEMAWKAIAARRQEIISLPD